MITYNQTKQSGYTLLQIAIALLVISVLMGSFFHIYNLYDQNIKAANTTENVNTVVQKLHTFRQSFGFYPCPAPMDADRNDTDYGTGLSYTGYLADPVGTCRDGICIEQSTRIIGASNPRVRVGAIPFRDMQMDENSTFDGYGSRIWYAVTEDMCNLATFKDTIGGINIINENGETQISPAGSAAFVVVSPGKNRVGAYAKYGAQSSACTTTSDSANCRDVSLATQPDILSTYVSSFVDEVGAATVYDDVIQYFASGAEQLWRRQNPTSENIVQLVNENLGVGTTTPPANELTLEQSTVDKNSSSSDYGLMVAPNRMSGSNDQNGALKVVSSGGGRLQADTYCDPTNTYCFQPKDIAGDAYTAGAGGMKCPNKQYMTGIKQGTATNAEAECAEDIIVSCPSGQHITSFTTDAGGGVKPVCSSGASLASCPAMTTTMCDSGDVSLPARAHGNYYPSSSTLITLKAAIGCSQARWYCNNGTWTTSFGFGGYWNVSAARCNNSSWSVGCGTGFSGSYTQYACGSNNQSVVCPPTCFNYGPVGEACPSGYSGTLYYNYICSGGAHVKTYSHGSCTCAAPSTKNLYSMCSAGYIRSGTAPTPPVSGVPSSNSWPSDNRYGKIAPLATLTTCVPPTYTGTYNDYCECNGADKYSQVLATVPSCKVAKSGTRLVNSTAYDFKYNVFKATVDTTTCTTNTATLVDPAQFNDITYFWRELPGGPIDTNKASSGGYPIVDSTLGCSCSGNGGASSVCAKAVAGGKYDFYQCKCQP